MKLKFKKKIKKMGALNCQKCINEDNKIINELLLEGKPSKSRKVITALESQETNITSPLKSFMNLSKEKINRFNNSNISEETLKLKEKIKKIYSEYQKGNKDALYDLDYNTLEVVHNSSDSYEEFHDRDSDFNDEEQEDFEEIHKILLANGNQDVNLNDFINQKIKESRQAQIEYEKENNNNEEDDDDLNNIKNGEIIDNPENYKIIYDNSMNNYNYQLNNNKFNNFSDFELSDDDNKNNINNNFNNFNNNNIIEEKEEFEIQESNNKTNKMKSNSNNNKIYNSSKSKYDNNNNNDKNNNRLYRQVPGKSIASYEIESDYISPDNNSK